MKRRLLLALAGLFLAAGAQAYEATKELSIAGYGTATQVALTTHSWTCVGCTSTLNRRGMITVTVPATNTGNVKFHWGNCSSTSLATATVTSEMLKGNGFTVLPTEVGTCIWGLTLHSATENIGYQELRQ